MGRNKKTYTEEFKKKCIKELLDGKTASEVCAGNSISPSTLSDWKKAILENGFGSKELKKAQKLQQDVCGVNKKYKLGLDNPKVDEFQSYIDKAAL